MSAIENLINHCAGLLDIDITETQEAAAELAQLRAELDKKDAALTNLFQACAFLPLDEMNRMEKEIHAASKALRGGDE